MLNNFTFYLYII